MLSENQLKLLVEQKPKDFNFKTLEYIQTVVKDPVGIGKPINIQFYAPANGQYDYQSM